MKKNILIILLGFLTANLSNAQDYSLSQPFEQPVLLNPANTGLQYQTRANLNYRQQWKSISKPFTTVIASADLKAYRDGNKGSSLGIGVVILNDQAGTSRLNTLNANLAVMGKVMINDMQSLSAGIIGGVMQRKIDGSDLTWTDQYDGYSYNASMGNPENFVSDKRTVPDFGAGVQWSYGQGAATLSSNDNLGAQFGFAAFHLNKPNTGFQEDNDSRYIRFVIHGTLSYGIKNTPFQINPGLIIQMQGPYRMYYFGSNVKYSLQESSKYTGNLLSRSLNIGCFYRIKDAIILSTQLEWDQYAFGISYDINLSQLSEATSGKGAIELSLRYIPVSKKSSGSRLL